MFQIAIYDTDRLFCEYFGNCVSMVTKKLKVECIVSVWHIESELIEYIKETGHIDVLFLGIEPITYTGIKIGKYIREELLDYETKLVYISEEQGDAMQLFETEPMDFLIKPVKKERIENVLSRFLKQQMDREKVFRYKEEYGDAILPYTSILYFQSMGHKILIHTPKGQKEFYGKLTDVENVVPDYFIRIHKSYLVNEKFICRFHYDKVILQNEQKLTISKSYRSAIRERVIERSENI